MTEVRTPFKFWQSKEGWNFEETNPRKAHYQQRKMFYKRYEWTLEEAWENWATQLERDETRAMVLA